MICLNNDPLEMALWEIRTTREFKKWLDSVNIEKYKKISKLITFIEKLLNEEIVVQGKALGDGLFELKEHHFGLRVYYTFKARKVIILLGGGDKTSQQRDIDKARKLMKDL